MQRLPKLLLGVSLFVFLWLGAVTFVAPVQADVCSDMRVTEICGGAGACRGLYNNGTELRSDLSPLFITVDNVALAANYALQVVYYNDAGQQTTASLVQTSQNDNGRIVFQVDVNTHPQLFYKSRINDGSETVKMLQVKVGDVTCDKYILQATQSYPGGDLPAPVVPPAVCNDDPNNHNLCSGEGGCSAGFRCEWYNGAGRCEKRRACGSVMECGLPNMTIGQCGYQGACGPGQQCTSDTDGILRCVTKAICSGVKECGSQGTLGQCGAAGGCLGDNLKCIEGTNGIRVCDVSATCVPPGDPPGDPPPTVCTRVGDCISGRTCIYLNGDLVPQGAACTPPADPPGDEEPPNPGLNIFDGPSADTFRQLNPFAILGGETAAGRFNSPAGIVNRALAFLFPLAGLALFFMLVWGGFEILSKAADAKAVQAGRQRITAALIGFILLFASFWIIQIVEWVFGLSIL